MTRTLCIIRWSAFALIGVLAAAILVTEGTAPAGRAGRGDGGGAGRHHARRLIPSD